MAWLHDVVLGMVSGFEFTIQHGYVQKEKAPTKRIPLHNVTSLIKLKVSYTRAISYESKRYYEIDDIRVFSHQVETSITYRLFFTTHDEKRKFS